MFIKSEGGYLIPLKTRRCICHVSPPWRPSAMADRFLAAADACAKGCGDAREVRETRHLLKSTRLEMKHIKSENLQIRSPPFCGHLFFEVAQALADLEVWGEVDILRPQKLNPKYK